MSYVEMIEIAGGVRELTDTELAMVAGGGVWGDLTKLAAGVVGGLLGGPILATAAVGEVILLQEAYRNYNPHAPLSGGTPIGDAAL
jgi:hypothetical protein